MAVIGDNHKPLVREWYKLKDRLKELQDQERTLRAQVVESVFGELVKGTQKRDLNDDLELVLSVSAKIDIDKDKFKDYKLLLENKGLIGDESVIKLKPEVSATAYKYMDAKDKAQFSDLFIHGFQSPQVEIRAKKGK